MKIRQKDMTKRVVFFTIVRTQVKMVTLHIGNVHHLVKNPAGAFGRHNLL